MSRSEQPREREGYFTPTAILDEALADNGETQADVQSRDGDPRQWRTALNPVNCDLPDLHAWTADYVYFVSTDMDGDMIFDSVPRNPETK